MVNMIRRFGFLCAAGLCLLIAASAPYDVGAQEAPRQPGLTAKQPEDRLLGPPVVSAKAWTIIDGRSGRRLGGDRDAESLPMASTTKIMTAWLVMQRAEPDAKILDEEVVVSAKAAKTGGSTASLKPGERYRARDLLFGLLLPSGNDAAVALAEHFGGRMDGDKDNPQEPLERFVAEMNRQAKMLGMRETRYFDPHGMGKNVSSARDLAVLAKTTMQLPLFRSYVVTRRHGCQATSSDGETRSVEWNNTNRLLGIEGYDGVKTGTTTAAGACLVASGRRGDDHLIVVVLGSTSSDGRYVDARNLFRWAWGELGHKE